MSIRLRSRAACGEFRIREISLGLAVGLGIALVAASSATVVVGVLGVVALAIAPGAVLITALLLIEEELSSAARSDALVSPLVTFMHHHLYGAHPPLLALLAGGTVVVLVARGVWHPPGPVAVAAMAALSYGMFTGVVDGSRNVRFIFGISDGWFVCAMAAIVGVTLSRDQLRAWVTRGVVGALGVKAVIALWVVAHHQGLVIGGGHLLVYYDSAIALVATVALATVLYLRDIPSAYRLGIGAGAFVVSALSFRRTVWIAVALVAVVIVPAVTKRLFLGIRLLVSAAALAVVVTIVAPSLGAAVVGRLSAITDDRTAAAGASTKGHFDDLRIGYAAARHVPFFGLGVDARQLHLLASNKTTALYVHDDYLQAWLRYGPVGLLLVLVFVAALVREAAAALRRTREPPLYAAALFCFSLPIVMIAFPVMTTSLRLPGLAGLAAGMLYADRRRTGALVGRRASAAVVV